MQSLTSSVLPSQRLHSQRTSRCLAPPPPAVTAYHPISRHHWDQRYAPSLSHTHPFNGPLSRTTRVSRCQKGKTNLDFSEARDSEWQWHQLGHMQVCTSLQTDNHASTPPLKFFHRPDALRAAQTTASKHERYAP